MNDLRPLIANVQDEESLLALLGKGLGWPIKEFGAATRRQPQIAEGVNFAGGEVTVRRLRPLDSEDKRPVFLVDFGEDRYLRRDLRALLRSLRAYEKGSAEVGASGVNDTLFVVAQNCWEDVRFVHFRPREGAQPEIRSFGWSDPNAPGRTVLEKNLFGLAWGEPDWQKAFDVEGLTEAFYDAFEKTFKQVRTQVVGAKDQDAAHEWTQLLFNRILFIAFIQRMGWLKAPGKPVGNYLQDLYQGGRGPFKTFLGVVRALVSELDTQPDDPTKDQFAKVLGSVPYLNGGLFSPDPIDTPGIDLPDEAFKAILGEPDGLFCRYNFTVTESTPLDQEVAVDPEMLGKVFERLVNDRHQEGKYYTPRPIVSFMVDEAIKGYLVEREVCTLEQAALLVDKGELRDKEAGIHIDADQMKPIREALLSVRAVDPACGSGAYLLGLLQKLFELVDRLNVEEKTGRELYQLKLRLLQHCVYGVDLDPVAVSIARLRLWLSLVVENRVDKRPDGTVEPPQPLPNLDFRVEHGDSLAAPVAPLQPDIFRDEQIRRFHALKLEYSQSTSKRRAELSPEIEELRAEIASGQEQLGGLMAVAEHPFDWTVEFAEVFQLGNSGRGGFDILVMNPPYVAANRLDGSVSGNFNKYMKAAKTSYGFSSDLFVHFLFRAIALLRDNGISASITPTTYYTNTTKEFLRSELLRWELSWLIPLPSSVFEATVYSGITIFRKSESKVHSACCYLDLRSGMPEGPFQKTIALNAVSVYLDEYRSAFACIFYKPTKENRWVFSQMLKAPNFFDVDGKLFAPLQIIAPALDTGIDSGNCRNKLFYYEEPADCKLPRILQGSQVVRYGYWWDSPAARYRYVDVAYVPDPTVAGTGRGGRPSSRGEYWSFRGPKENHYAAERLLMRQTEDEPYVGFVSQENEIIYTDNTIHTLLLTPVARQRDISYHYLLAILNSTPARRIYQAIAQEEGRTLAQVKTNLVNRLPIPIPSKQEQSNLEFLVQKIINILEKGLPLSVVHRQEVAQLQEHIDRRVEFLYFHSNEASTYDEWVAKREAEKGTVIEQIRKLVAVGHEVEQLEFKSSFAWDIRQNVRGDYLKDEVHTAICAMLNAKGGDLLIGVDNDGNILGLRNDLDRYGDKDKLIQAIEGPLGDKLKPNPIGLVDIKAIDIDGKTIVRVCIKPDNTERYQFKDQIYVRRNSKSKPALTADEAAAWWPKRQRGEV